MNTLIGQLAKVAASKLVGALLSLGLAVGIVVPLDTSDQVTAALTLAITLVLQVAYQAGAAWVEKHYPHLTARRVLALVRRTV